MDVITLYEQIGGNYSELVGRLGSDKLVNRLLTLFIEDGGFGILKSGMAENDYDTAFRGAHGLKGLCANLAITEMGKTVSEMTECLRNSSDINRAKEILPVLEEEYCKVTSLIGEYLKN